MGHPSSNGPAVLLAAILWLGPLADSHIRCEYVFQLSLLCCMGKYLSGSDIGFCTATPLAKRVTVVQLFHISLSHPLAPSSPPTHTLPLLPGGAGVVSDASWWQWAGAGSTEAGAGEVQAPGLELELGVVPYTCWCTPSLPAHAGVAWCCSVWVCFIMALAQSGRGSEASNDEKHWSLPARAGLHLH